MFTTIITDCKSDNAKLRQITRFNTLGLGPTTLAGVSSNFGFDPTIEAAGNLIDALDAAGGEEGVVSVNVAPRGEKKVDGENGTSFSYFYYKETLVISTIKGHCLSLVEKFSLVKSVKLLDISKVLDYASQKKLIPQELKNQITNSQFRSFDFVPRAAKWIIDGINIPSEEIALSTFPDAPDCIWCIDAFGNCKTTLTQNNLPCKESPLKVIKTNLGNFKYYERLKDIPKDETAIYTGSSGIGNTRFLEIATQGVVGSAAKKLGLKIGTELKLV